ncbi:MAG: S-methyl-5-thioribose-1-phosphate isomerase, partial [Thermoplasmata archaeon]
TYEKALIAKDNSVPFYVAAPTSTIDFSLPEGQSIPIEERSESEVLYIGGNSIAPKGSKARNPAFDVTSKDLITGIITEKGIHKPYELRNLQG